MYTFKHTVLSMAGFQAVNDAYHLHVMHTLLFLSITHMQTCAHTHTHSHTHTHTHTHEFIPLISRPSFSCFLSSCLLTLLPVVLHVEQERWNYLVHVINIPNVQLHTVLTSYLLNNSPEALQPSKPCSIILLYISYTYTCT